MAFAAGDFTPFPVSSERGESPPPELDQEYPFIGVELIVSGLPRTSFTSAADHLKSVLADLRDVKQIPLPELRVQSAQQPSTLNTDPLDYVYVSLAGSLRTVPRPDVLERVRAILNELDGPVRAQWRVANGPTDKSRQVWFASSVTSLPSHTPQSLQKALLNICRSQGYAVQRSYVLKDGGKIFVMFENEDSVRKIIAMPPVVDGQSVWAHPTRYIQPVFGLEVAVNGVGAYSNAQSIIDRHIERTYGDGSGERVVRKSRLEMEGSVYCAVLLNPSITARFLHDDFNLFRDFGAIPVGKPEYLFMLNCNGVPNINYSSRNTTSNESQNPLLQRQVDNLTAEVRAQNEGMMEVARTQMRMQDEMLKREERQSERDARMFLHVATSSMLSEASMRTMCIESSLDNAQQQLLCAPEGPVRDLMTRRVEDLTRQLHDAQAERGRRLSDFASLQAQSLISNMPALSPQSGTVEETEEDGGRMHKRSRGADPVAQTDGTRMEIEEDIPLAESSSSKA